MKSFNFFGEKFYLFSKDSDEVIFKSNKQLYCCYESNAIMYSKVDTFTFFKKEIDYSCPTFKEYPKTIFISNLHFVDNFVFYKDGDEEDGESNKYIKRLDLWFPSNNKNNKHTEYKFNFISKEKYNKVVDQFKLLQ